MKTNFFTQMKELCKEHDFNMTFKTKDETIAIALYPKAKIDLVKEEFPPLTFSGTAEELDDKFFESIKNAMVKTSNIVSSISFFAKQMEEKKKAAENKALGKKTPVATAKKETKPAEDMPEDDDNEETSDTIEKEIKSDVAKEEAKEKPKTLFD